MALSLSGSLLVADTIQVSGSSVIPTPTVSEAVTTGTDRETTTTSLRYGINTLTVNNTGSYYAKLPSPQVGRSLTVINNSSYAARIIASGSAGIVNGRANGYAVIPPDGQAYDFICSRTSGTGVWSLNRPTSIQTIRYSDMTVPHVSGSLSRWTGVGTFATPAPGSPITSSGWGAGLTTGSIMYLIPTASAWRSEPIQATAVRMRVYTNIVAADLPQFNPPMTQNDPKSMALGMWGAFAYDINAVTTGQRSYAPILSYTSGAFTPDSSYGTNIFPVLGTPGADVLVNIADPGTIYADTPMFGGSVGIGRGDGNTWNYSPYYYTFYMIIGAGFPTKDYKFRFEIDYI